jgi:hypothetical protein
MIVDHLRWLSGCAVNGLTQVHRGWNAYGRIDHDVLSVEKSQVDCVVNSAPRDFSADALDSLPEIAKQIQVADSLTLPTHKLQLSADPVYGWFRKLASRASISIAARSKRLAVAMRGDRLTLAIRFAARKFLWRVHVRIQNLSRFISVVTDKNTALAREQAHTFQQRSGDSLGSMTGPSVTVRAFLWRHTFLANRINSRGSLETSAFMRTNPTDERTTSGLPHSVRTATKGTMSHTSHIRFEKHDRARLVLAKERILECRVSLMRLEAGNSARLGQFLRNCRSVPDSKRSA